MTLVSLAILIGAVASLILSSQHSLRCSQIEHIVANVHITPKVMNSLEFLYSARRNLKNIIRLIAIPTLYAGLAVTAFFWAEGIDKLMYLAGGASLVTLATILFLEARIARFRRNAPRNLPRGES